MKIIKTYKKFNEELSPEVSELFWQSKLLGTLGYLATFGISYFVFHLINGKSKDSSLNDTKKVINKLRKNDEFKSVLTKVLDNEQIKSLLEEHKDKLENRTITYNEMKRLAEKMKQDLGDILTSDEWQLCDDLIDEILNPSVEEDSDKFTQREIEILQRNGFEKTNSSNLGLSIGVGYERTYTNKELNVDIVKMYSKYIKYYYIIETPNNKGFFASFSPNKLKESGRFTTIDDCIDDIKNNTEIN